LSYLPKSLALKEAGFGGHPIRLDLGWVLPSSAGEGRPDEIIEELAERFGFSSGCSNPPLFKPCEKCVAKAKALCKDPVIGLQAFIKNAVYGIGWMGIK